MFDHICMFVQDGRLTAFDTLMTLRENDGLSLTHPLNFKRFIRTSLWIRLM